MGSAGFIQYVLLQSPESAMLGMQDPEGWRLGVEAHRRRVGVAGAENNVSARPKMHDDAIL